MLINYKKIGDTLNTKELNAYITLLRHNKKTLETIQLKNGEIQGTHAKYTFTLQSTTNLDNGILITNNTLTTLGTVTLTDPVYPNSTYTLKLDVISYDDAELCNNQTTNTEHQTLTITLEENTSVPIPITTLLTNNIIQYTAQIEIQHNKPIIVE